MKRVFRIRRRIKKAALYIVWEGDCPFEREHRHQYDQELVGAHAIVTHV
jgi:hypothetical protein